MFMSGDAYGPLPAFLYGMDLVSDRQTSFYATVTMDLLYSRNNFPRWHFLSSSIIGSHFTITYGQLFDWRTIFISFLLYRHQESWDFQLIFTLLKLLSCSAALPSDLATARHLEQFLGTYIGAKVVSQVLWPRWCRALA